MTYTNEILQSGKKPASYWAGWALSGLFITFLALASIVPKLFIPEMAAASIAPLGWGAEDIPRIAAIEIAGLLLYAAPRTSVSGAIVLTGLLGGAMASHVRVDSPLLSHTLFGIYLAMFMWGGLWLRNPALRALILGRV
jgi:DoxX-like family